MTRQNYDFHYTFNYFITFFREAIVVWSSWESFKAVWTLEAFATISAFSSRHFCINRFSLSWDFFNALCNFSYSTRNFSRLLSPMSSPRTYKTIEKSKWFMDIKLAILSLREYYNSKKKAVLMSEFLCLVHLLKISFKRFERIFFNSRLLFGVLWFFIRL